MRLRQADRRHDLPHPDFPRRLIQVRMNDQRLMQRGTDLPAWDRARRRDPGRQYCSVLRNPRALMGAQCRRCRCPRTRFCRRLAGECPSWSCRASTCHNLNSPTMPRISPSRTSNETSSSAFSHPIRRFQRCERGNTCAGPARPAAPLMMDLSSARVSAKTPPLASPLLMMQPPRPHQRMMAAHPMAGPGRLRTRTRLPAERRSRARSADENGSPTADRPVRGISPGMPRMPCSRLGRLASRLLV